MNTQSKVSKKWTDKDMETMFKQGVKIVKLFPATSVSKAWQLNGKNFLINLNSLKS